MTKEQQKFYSIKHFSDYDVVGDDIDYKVIVNDDTREIILQYEESDSRNDWVNNLLFIPWPLDLGGGTTVWTTLGFARAYKSTNGKPLLEFLNAYKNNIDYKLIIRGWSFGSAMAKITARHLACTTAIEIDELTTFGDVKCWLNPFFKNKAKRLREYVTANDFVTWCVPFYHRDKKCKVGRKFSLKEIFNTEYYHTHYEDYDYTRYE